MAITEFTHSMLFRPGLLGLIPNSINSILGTLQQLSLLKWCFYHFGRSVMKNDEHNSWSLVHKCLWQPVTNLIKHYEKIGHLCNRFKEKREKSIWPFLAQVKQKKKKALFIKYILIDFCKGGRVLYDNHWFTFNKHIICKRKKNVKLVYINSRYPRIQRNHRISI